MLFWAFASLFCLKHNCFIAREFHDPPDVGKATPAPQISEENVILEENFWKLVDGVTSVLLC